MWAPWMTDWPTPPQPMTATVEPGDLGGVQRRRGRRSRRTPAAPAAFVGEVGVHRDDRRLVHDHGSAKVHPQTAAALAGRHSALRRLHRGLSSRWLDIPLRHHQRVPHAGRHRRQHPVTRRTRHLVPTASTILHASWPGTMGGSAVRPSIDVQVWQIRWR